MFSTLTEHPTGKRIADLIVGVTGVLLLIFCNPFWYGDSVWYATDLHNGELLPLDPGHLLWKPIAALLWSIQSFFFIPCDPLLVLQVMSAVSSVLSCFLLYRLARVFDVSTPALAPFLFFCSHFTLVYGGSGSSYSTCVMFLLLAVLYFSERSQSGTNISLPTALITSLFLALSISAWGPGVLGIPTVMILPFILRQELSKKEKIKCSILLGFFSCVFFGVLLVIAFLFSEGTSNLNEFFGWLKSSDHGIPVGFNLLNAFRAILGFCQNFLHLGNLGTTMKDLLTGGGENLELYPLGVFALFWCVLLIMIFVVRASLPKRKTGLLFLASAIPSLLFGALWQGSDIERFSLTLPFLVLFLVSGTELQSKFLDKLLRLTLFFFAVHNVSIVLFFPSQTKAGLISEFIDISRDYLPRESLIILTGQDLGPRVWVPTSYHSSHTIFSFLYDSQTEGLENWETRLEAEITDAEEQNRKIVVLDSLIAEKPASPRPLLTAVDPHPAEDDIRAFFESFSISRFWQVQEYTFAEVVRHSAKERQINN